MKTYIHILALTALIISCDLDLDINRDPDKLDQDEVALSSELAVGTMGIAAVQSSYYALIGGIWSQYWAQSLAASQYRIIDNYSIGSTDYQAAWSNMYDALSDIKNAKRIAFKDGNWNYFLITTCLDVYATQIMTDFYGDVPYTEANQGISIPEPKFDSSQDLYDLFISDIDAALAKDLSTSSSPAPAGDDFIFGGNMTNWIEFANTLKLKIYLRQTKIRPTIASAGITAMIAANVEFLTTNAGISTSIDVFKDEANISNPLYETDRRQLNTQSNLRASATLWTLLDNNNDERLKSFYGEGTPMLQGDFNSTAAPNSVSIANLTPLAPVFFITAAQSYLMQAEAMERYNGGSGAKALYDQGVTAAFDKSPNFYDNDLAESAQKWIYDEAYDATPYIADTGVYEYPSAGTLEEKVEAIITQKWISCYPDNGFESFFEQLRTGYPSSFTHAVNAVIPGFPQRIVYPNEELSRNSNAPSSILISVPVWWNN
jgi:hypothetical protein